MSADRWEAYIYPGTPVLVNKAGIKDQDKLNSFEREVTALRLAELRQKPVAPTFDLAHMQAIHRHVFQDVYEWAGQVRDVDLSKGAGESRTVFARSGDIEAVAADISALIHAGNLLRGLTKQDFAFEMGMVYTAVNDLHPFREGNGRVTREFMTQLAEAAGYDLDFKKVDRQTWNEAATEAAHGDSAAIIKVFDRISAPSRQRVVTPMASARDDAGRAIDSSFEKVAALEAHAMDAAQARELVQQNLASLDVIGVDPRRFFAAAAMGDMGRSQAAYRAELQRLAPQIAVECEMAAMESERRQAGKDARKSGQLVLDLQASEAGIRADLTTRGYLPAECSGPYDREYIGPIVAETPLHVAQDLGRMRAVIHDVSRLDKKPGMGERLIVKFKQGVGSVLGLVKAGMEMGR